MRSFYLWSLQIERFCLWTFIYLFFLYLCIFPLWSWLKYFVCLWIMVQVDGKSDVLPRHSWWLWLPHCLDCSKARKCKLCELAWAPQFPLEIFFLKFLRSEFAEFTLPAHFQLGRGQRQFCACHCFSVLVFGSLENLQNWHYSLSWCFFSSQAEQKLIFQVKNKLDCITMFTF